MGLIDLYKFSNLPPMLLKSSNKISIRGSSAVVEYFREAN